MTRLRLLAATLVLATATGCASAFTEARQTRPTAHLATQGVSVQAPMVAHPLARTLAILIDPKKVPDAFPVRHSVAAIDGFQRFVGESLAKTLGPYFQKVEIVHPGDPVPKGPFVEAVVKVPGISAHNIVMGYLNYAILHMNWAVAFRTPASSDYLFSFAGEATSDQSYRTFYQGCRQTMRSALSQLLKAWADKGVYDKLRSLSASKPKGGGFVKGDLGGGGI